MENENKSIYYTADETLNVLADYVKRIANRESAFPEELTAMTEAASIIVRAIYS